MGEVMPQAGGEAALRFEWADQWVAVAIRPSRRARRVHLKVLPPRRVEMVVPYGFDRRQAPAILERYRHWLIQHLERLGALHPGVVERPSELSLAAVGRHYLIEYLPVPSHRPQLRELSGGRLQLTLAEEGGWRPLLLTWLRQQAAAELAPWLAAVAAASGLHYQRVSIRDQRSRWGSCSARGTISLNFRLLFLPPTLVRYLFVHELCHTVHLNHSAAFWGLVASKEPAYRQLDAEVRGASRHVPLWALPE